MIRLKIPVSLQLSHNGDTLLVPYLQNLLHMNLWCVKAWLWDIFLLLLIVSFITRHTISKEQKKKKTHFSWSTESEIFKFDQWNFLYQEYKCPSSWRCGSWAASSGVRTCFPSCAFHGTLLWTLWSAGSSVLVYNQWLWWGLWAVEKVYNAVILTLCRVADVLPYP